MDRANYELMAALRLADLHREAAARRTAGLARRRGVPVLLNLGGIMVRAGHWLQRLGQPCPHCPAPALS